jgi:peptidoglycan hydrolase CwlO-like protein
MSETSIKALRDRIGDIRRLIERDKSHKDRVARDRDKVQAELDTINKKILIYNNSINKKKAEIDIIQADINDLQKVRQ